METEKKDDKITLKLKEEVAKVYDVATGHVREFIAPGLGKVDLNTVNLSMAAKLEKLGVLVKKEKAVKGTV